MQRWLQWLEERLGGGPNGRKRITTFRLLLLVGLVGVLLLLVSSFLSVEQGDLIEKQSPAASLQGQGGGQEVFLNSGQTERASSLFENIEYEYESRLKDLLENLVGVGKVDVMVTVESTEELIVYRDSQESHQVTNEEDGSATRHITQVTRSGQIVLHEVSGGERPIVLKTLRPDIRGVVVIAEGAENVQVKALLLDAVQKGLGVKPQEVSILPRKQQ
ncbi:stage III sporulation protein AG [Xylanibacillus composti]|uniref:Stage III sporulation protein AG n=1 Tax=Xylanibacillus composti TaxID=1572762 RepID=A0A8J4M424_9BACL|nr:stage III sporulation protein AG [Xylanibacillus composti]MDT9726284.1 stage III sporulation protein AG [Xylanibacillus composti]GIQ70687.1 stage III sporulation protein AG [Xylanibacillus composti]